MQRKQKLTVVAIVMSIGLALAMLFLQPADHQSQAVRDNANGHELSGFSATPFTTARRESSSAGGSVSPSADPRTFKQYSVEPRLSGTIEAPLDGETGRSSSTGLSGTGPGASSQPTSPERGAAPTEFTPFRPANRRLTDHQLPSSAQTKSHAFRQPTGDNETRFRVEDPSDFDDHDANRGGGSQAWPLEPFERKHEVVDGDSLQALAQKYLGNPDRADDLFYYNRDILRSEELLPLGKELRIPPADFRPPALPASEVENSKQLFPVAPIQPANAPVSGAGIGSSNATTVNASNPTTGRMINVWRSASTGGNPLRSLPESDSARTSPSNEPRIASSRSYTVESHDTLALIARKVYGDIQHKNVILQANTSQLRGSQDLRPGMVLAVPVLDPARTDK